VTVLNSLFPIFALLVFGWFLKRVGLTDRVFLKTCDRLIYYFFFPVMLFWKIGGNATANGLDFRLVWACLASLAVLFVVSSLTVRWAKVTSFQAGSFSQSCYRFNTYIGMAVILNATGSEGVKYFGLVVAVVIPLINVFAVSLLIWFSGLELSGIKKLRLTIKALIANPLILGCVAGLIYSRAIGVFPVFLNNTLSLVSMVSLPLALLSIGGTLTFAGLRGNLVLAHLAAAEKLVLLPLVGFCFLHFFGVSGVPFRVGMIFFALPASTAIYVLSSQLNSDPELASAAIVVSTVLSFASLSIALLV